jgi:putative phosphoesterase
MKIGLISDTHNYLDPSVAKHFEQVDEIWHAGDFGSHEIAEQLSKIAPVVGVYGNIDGQDIRSEFPLHQRFSREGCSIWMTHIGGVPGRYCIPVRGELSENPPDLFVCGHSHILKIARDKEHQNMIYLNPGAAGKQGFQTIRTLLRFSIEDSQVRDMEVIELTQ